VISSNATQAFSKCVEFTTIGNGIIDGPEDCLTWETVTPGSVIAAQINEVTTSPIRQLEQADKYNEVFGAFFDQLLNWLYSEGLGSLRGRDNGNQFSLGTTGSNVVIGSNGQPINTSASTNVFGYNISGTGISTNDFDVSRPQQLRTVLEVQYKYLNQALDARATELQIVPVLGALDYCIPGPNPTWKVGLDENVRTYAGSLQVEITDGSGSGTGGSIGSGVGAIAGSIIPGIGTAIGSAVGNLLGGLLGGLIDNGKPHGLDAFNVSLFDKVTNGPILIRNTSWFEKNRSPQAVAENLQLRMNEVFSTYETSFTKEGILNAFLAVDSGNASYVQGFVQSSFDETAKLPEYDLALSAIDDDYVTSIADTREAIAELEAIREEVNSIVATAKARYIAQQAAAGTPVNQTCIDAAYKIDTSPIVVPPRQESDNPTPFLFKSLEAASYFYSHL
jgi:hypothetical protein